MSTRASGTARLCSDKVLGGQYRCGEAYGSSGQIWHTFPDGTRQVFVIGRDFAVWTNGSHPDNGGWTGWYTLGGNLRGRVHTSSSTGWEFSIAARGGNGNWWYRDRHPSGLWTDWHQGGWKG